MTINYARESVIDFTKPFMNLGISILFKVSRLIENPISTCPSHTQKALEGINSYIERGAAVSSAAGDEFAGRSDYATGAASASGIMPSAALAGARSITPVADETE